MGDYQHNRFMQQAILQAKKAITNNEVPVGGVLVYDGNIISKAHNLTCNHHDPTAHAEMILLRNASKKLQTPRLTNCDLYVTLEPCAMCAAAISAARIRRLYFGAYDKKAGAVENGICWFNQPNCNHRPEIYGGIAETECSMLLKEFFHAKR